jgi:hypothetical protein
MKLPIIALAGAIALAGCSSSTTGTVPPVTLQTVANDVSLLATGLNNALSQPSVVALIPPTIEPQIKAVLNDLTSVAGTVGSSTSASAAKASVTTVENDVNTIVAALAGLPLPPPAPTILTAAEVLLPVVEAAVGLVVPASAASGAMTADEARMHLAAGK